MLFKWINAGSIDSEIEKVKEISLASAGLKEKDLENIVAKKIDDLVRADQLMVIMQERKMKEEPDIIAIDQKGLVYIFELKRWESVSENLLQVLRYGQKFGRYSYEQLNRFYKTYAHNRQGDLELQGAHKNFFDLKTPLDIDDFNKDQCFVVVTNGLDYDTWDAIAYWKNKGLNIVAQVYRIFKVGDELLIDFDPYGPISDVPKQPETGLFVVNTNKTYMPDAYKDMVNERKGSAYYDKKYSIQNIRAGNPVCLYHVGVGIIGIGKAKTDFIKRNVDSDPDEEYYVPIEFEYLVDINESSWYDKAVHTREINNNFSTGYKFRQTVFQLPYEFAGYIRKQFEQKGLKKA